MTVIEHRKRRRIALQQQLPIRGLVVDHHLISRSRPHLVTEVNDASTIVGRRAVAFACSSSSATGGPAIGAGAAGAVALAGRRGAAGVSGC
jgi:hypothetical protein